MDKLDNIIAKIISDANKKASDIMVEANNNIEKYTLLKENDKNKEIEKLRKDFISTKNLELERINSEIELKSRNILLSAKKDIISNIFDKLYSSVQELDDDRYISYVNNILQNRIKQENEILMIPKKYENVLSKIEVKNGQVSDKIKDGFVIEYRGIEENYTLNSMIKFNSEIIENRITELLFN